MQTVLVTGAAGGIGTRLRQLLKGVYPNLRLSDVKQPADLAADETFVEADLASMPAVETAVAGVDGIEALDDPADLRRRAAIGGQARGLDLDAGAQFHHVEDRAQRR